jgi:hypothetical protein
MNEYNRIQKQLEDADRQLEAALKATRRGILFVYIGAVLVCIGLLITIYQAICLL